MASVVSEVALKAASSASPRLKNVALVVSARPLPVRVISSPIGARVRSEEVIPQHWLESRGRWPREREQTGEKWGVPSYESYWFHRNCGGASGKPCF